MSADSWTLGYAFSGQWEHQQTIERLNESLISRGFLGDDGDDQRERHSGQGAQAGRAVGADGVGRLLRAAAQASVRVRGGGGRPPQPRAWRWRWRASAAVKPRSFEPAGATLSQPPRP